MTLLLFDAGNSRLKWLQVTDDAPPVSGVCPMAKSSELDRVTDWTRFASPDRILLCSVVDPAFEERFGRWCQGLWGLAPEVFPVSGHCCGVTNRYHEPVQLGPDRWAALIGARSLYQGAVIVVDCGTAITVDGLDGDGVYQGGVIMPGLDTMRRSLMRDTNHLVAGDPGEACVFCRQTDHAVESGLRFAAAGGVEKIVERMERSLGEATLVICGGGAGTVSAALERAPVDVPDLVFRGLEQYARETA